MQTQKCARTAIFLLLLCAVSIVIGDYYSTDADNSTNNGDGLDEVTATSAENTVDNNVSLDSVKLVQPSTDDNNSSAEPNDDTATVNLALRLVQRTGFCEYHNSYCF